MSDRAKLLLMWGLVPLVPVLLVMVGDRVFWSATKRPSPGEGGVMMVDSAITALPFLVFAIWATVIALRGSLGDGWLAGATAGVFVSAGLWLYYYWDGYTYWRDGGSGGANIGLSLLMLASPVLVGAAMAIGHRLGR